MLDYISLIDHARDAGKFRSDRALSVHLGFKPQAVCEMRKFHRPPSDEAIMGLCEITGDDPVEKILAAQIMRASDETRDFWTDLANKVAELEQQLVA